MTNTFIICRAKRRGNSSWHLEQALREQGVEAYRVTPNHTPAKDLGWASTFINYGCSNVPLWWDDVPHVSKLLNSFTTVIISSNKLMMSRAFRDAGVPCLTPTRNRYQAEGWASEGHTVVCRTLTRASQGRGIVLANTPEEVVDAGMYTQLFKGYLVREYRVYIVNGKAVDITEKRRRSSAWYEENGVDRSDPITRLIRTNGHGWVFARKNLRASEHELDEIKHEAVQAAASIGLGFGAVDMMVDRHRHSEELNRIVAVETNTSVGIHNSPTTCERLACALAKEINYG